MSDEKSWEKHLEQKKKNMAEPFMDIFDDNTFKIRRNLIAISTIILFYKIVATGINTNSSFLGVKFEGLEKTSFDIPMAIIVFYFLIHFIWSALDKYREWKLRLTGMTVPKASNQSYASNSDETGTNIQNQATLSSWWIANVKGFETNNINKSITSLNDNETIQNLTREFTSIKKSLDELNQRGAHIEIYLQRYKKGFDNLQVSQKWRWILLEFLAPIVMAISALILIIF